jgi:hypothetical protein
MTPPAVSTHRSPSIHWAGAEMAGSCSAHPELRTEALAAALVGAELVELPDRDRRQAAGRQIPGSAHPRSFPLARSAARPVKGSCPFSCAHSVAILSEFP